MRIRKKKFVWKNKEKGFIFNCKCCVFKGFSIDVREESHPLGSRIKFIVGEPFEVGKEYFIGSS